MSLLHQTSFCKERAEQGKATSRASAEEGKSCISLADCSLEVRLLSGNIRFEDVTERRAEVAVRTVPLRKIMASSDLPWPL